MTDDTFERMFDDIELNFDEPFHPRHMNAHGEREVQELVNEYFRDNPVTEDANVVFRANGEDFPMGSIRINRERATAENIRGITANRIIGMDIGTQAVAHNFHNIDAADIQEAMHRQISELMERTRINRERPTPTTHERQGDGDGDSPDHVFGYRSFQHETRNPMVHLEGSQTYLLKQRLQVLHGILNAKGLPYIYQLLGYIDKEDETRYVRCPLCQSEKIQYKTKAKRKSNHINLNHPTGPQRFWEAASRSTKIMHLTKTCHCHDCKILLSEHHGISGSHMKPTFLGSQLIEAHRLAVNYVLSQPERLYKEHFNRFFDNEWYTDLGNQNGSYYYSLNRRHKIQHHPFITTILDFAYHHVPKPTTEIPNTSL